VTYVLPPNAVRAVIVAEQKGEIAMEIKVGVTMTTKRGPESWAYIYIMLGFALAIEATVISMIEPLRFPWNIVVFAVVASFTVWLFILNGRFQNKLIALKLAYENKGR
jgi:hypothetical protein